MARKLRGFERVLDAPALFAVAYGEIASSLYIALGIVAAQALGFTPLVLLLTGALFLVVSLSYAEGTAALPETGGAATFVRRAFNDLAGFVTGWALFLDFLIVMALSAMFAPHYLATATSVPSVRESPWDTLVACGLIAAIAGIRLTRRTRLHLGALGIALLDLVVQALLVVLGIAFLLSPHDLVGGFDLATDQDWGDLAFALPLACSRTRGSRRPPISRRRHASPGVRSRARSSPRSGSWCSSPSRSPRSECLRIPPSTVRRRSATSGSRRPSSGSPPPSKGSCRACWWTPSGSQSACRAS